MGTNMEIDFDMDSNGSIDPDAFFCKHANKKSESLDLGFGVHIDQSLSHSAVQWSPLHVTDVPSMLNHDDFFDDILAWLEPSRNTGDADNAPVLPISGSYAEDQKVDMDDMDTAEIYRQIYGVDSGILTQKANHADAQQMLQLDAQLEQSHSTELSLSPTPSSDSYEMRTVTSDRQTEIDEMAEYTKAVIERSNSTKPDGTSSKLKVHEVILVILLNAVFGDPTKDLRRILAFCDKDGREVSGESWHFKTLDTETMGALWMKIKGNRNASYDTFARAMRVRREKSKGYFDYLEKKRSKKRVYRFGETAVNDMIRIKQTLRYFSEHQTFGSGN